MENGPVQPSFFGKRDQKMIEKVSPAKNVEAALAVCPARKPRIADAVQESMITTIKTMSNRRWRCGVNMV